MKALKIIRDEDIGESFPTPSAYREQVSARAVIFDDEGKLALLNATKKNFHKLPGGGVEKGEDIQTALARELREEIGCAARNLRKIGIVEECRNKYALHQVSHCFLANLDGEIGATDLDESEIADGFKTVWMNLKDAIKTLESESAIENYEGKFIRLRELAFLREAANVIRA